MFIVVYFLGDNIDLQLSIRWFLRKLIFKQDTNYNKIATTDKRDNYEIPFMNGWVGTSTTIPRSCKKERAQWTHL